MDETATVSLNLFGQDNAKWIETGQVQIGVSASHNAHVNHKNTDSFLIGKIDNLSGIAKAHHIDPYLHALEICRLLVEKNGWPIIKKWKGCFAFIAHDNKKNELRFTIGDTGLMQSYIVQEKDRIIITSELKAFGNTTFFKRKMIPIDSYQYEYTKRVEPDFCFLENVRRIIPGFIYTVHYQNLSMHSVDQTELFPIQCSSISVSKKEAKEKIYSLLNENITDKIHSKKIGIPISGGLDSGLIASLVHRQVHNIHTYTVGTDFGNEYANAKEVQRFLSSDHEEIHIDETGFWEGFLQSVWHNEICDPLYAEGYVSFYHVFKQAQKNVSQLLTGYGADLVLGDFLLINDKSGINAFSEYWCRRAAWTGEMSPYTAHSFGLEIQHPFWEIELINFSLSIPFEYKYLGDEVKAVLREMAEEKKLLPHSIAWQKKNALTTGTSLDQLFSYCLNIPYEKNYRFKSIFLYYLFEDLFVLDKPLSTINIKSLIEKTRKYAG